MNIRTHLYEILRKSETTTDIFNADLVGLLEIYAQELITKLYSN
jgi:hypothetical protein